MLIKDIELTTNERIIFKTNSYLLIFSILFMTFNYIFLYTIFSSNNQPDYLLSSYILIKTPIMLILILSFSIGTSRYTLTNKRLIVEIIGFWELLSRIILKRPLGKISISFSDITKVEEIKLLKLNKLIGIKISSDKKYMSYSFYLVKNTKDLISKLQEQIEINRGKQSISNSSKQGFQVFKFSKKQSLHYIIFGSVVFYILFIIFVTKNPILFLNMINKASIPVAICVTYSNPKDDRAYYHLASAYEKNKSYKLAIENYKKAIRFSPKEDKRKFFDKANYYRNLGKLYFNERQYVQAINSFKQVLVMHPQNGEAYKVIAESYMQMKDYNKANINFKKAIINYKKAISLHPNAPFYYAELGKIYLEQGNYEEAEKTYKKLLQFPPKEIHKYCLNITELKSDTNLQSIEY